MDFHLTEDQEMIRDSGREFADRVLRPHAARLDAEEAFPLEAIQEAAESGFLGLTIPEELALIEAGPPEAKLPSFPTEKEMGLDMAFQWGSDEESYHRYSPITRYREIHCPLLYLVGSEDRNAQGGKLLVDKLQELGRTAEYSLHPGMPHAFYWGIRPDKDGNLPSEFYRALKVTTDFLRKHVKDAGKTGE